MKILIATVPLSGHVNPAIPIARQLLADGHEVAWYTGSAFKSVVESTGAAFYPFINAKNYCDSDVHEVFPQIPSGGMISQAKGYIRHVFYGNMKGQYHDLCRILEQFSAALILTDEWFTGAIPLAETGRIPWICFGNSPLFFYDDVVPFPGAGAFPGTDIWSRNRNRSINFVATRIVLAPLQRYINSIRKELGLSPMKRFFLINNLFLARLTLKFNTPAFEFPWKYLPSGIRFVGPVLPPAEPSATEPWMNDDSRPLIFITQGSVNNTDTRQLIEPSIKALCNSGFTVAVSAPAGCCTELRQRCFGAHVYIRPYIPYSDILSRASVMITNGGFGGVITALYHGVPIVVAGMSEDKPEIATRIGYCGAGINLRTGKPSPTAILNAVRKILSEPCYRNAAAKISDDFRKTHAIKEIVRLVEKVADGAEG